jgi:hypothetical protein
MNGAAPSDTSFTIIVGLVYLALYIASLVAFGIFVMREEGTVKAKTFAVVFILVGILLVFVNRVIGGGVMVAACFYAADRKNRSRMWALPALFFGPLVLLWLVCLPKLQDTSAGLHLNA